MAVNFAYVPSTFDGQTVRDPQPHPITIDPEPSADPWSWLDMIRDDAPEAVAPEAVAVA